MKRIAPLIAAAILFAQAPHAFAQAYVGGSIGRSDATDNHDQFTDQFLDLGFDAARSRGETHDTGWRGFAGYGFGDYFAIEGAYVDLGSFKTRTDVQPSGTFRSKSDIDGYELGAVGRFPIGDRFSLYARVGAFRGKLETKYSGDGSVEVFDDQARQSKRSTKATYAIGAGYRLGDHVATRVEWARYNDLGDTLTGGRTDVDLVSIGVAYVF